MPALGARPQYWGAYAGFDTRARQGKFAHPKIVPPKRFRNALLKSFGAMARRPARADRVRDNLFFVMAWNEWGEQAVLEPTDMYRFEYLEAVRSATRRVPVGLPWPDAAARRPPV